MARIFPKLRKEIHQQPVKRGRRLVGARCKLPDGRQVLLIKRKHGDIHRGRCKSIAEAAETGVAAWGLDVDVTMRAIREGVKVVGIYVEETHEVYLACAETWRQRAKMMTGRRGPLQRFLTLDRFRKSAAIIKI